MSHDTNLSVDPGAIRDFARFLDSQARPLAQVHARMSARESARADFGEHPAADQAEREHLKVVSSAVDNAGRLKSRHEELVRGTEELAKQYADLDGLNSAAAHEVDAVMRQGARSA